MPATVLAALAGLGWLAQSAAPPASSSPVVTIAVEQRAERYRYRFDHPSNFDTVELVPHFFEQKYDAGNTWITGAVSYSVLGSPARTRAGFTPRVTTVGSDIDTFFQPSGDIVTSGTDGRVRWRSFAIDQRLGLSTIGPWTLGVSMGYRRSRADFLPDDIIVTHTQPPSVTRTFTTTRETTISRLFTSGVAADLRKPIGRGWDLAIEGTALPLTRARLVISLPDKYDHDLVYDALAMSAEGCVRIDRAWSKIRAGVSFSASGAWGYRSTSNYRHHGFGGGVFVSVGR